MRSSISQSLEYCRVQACHIDLRARRRSYCTPLAQSVVQTSLLRRRPSNELSCPILIMCRHCARLSLIVSHRMLFMDQYFHCAPGCRGVAQCLHMAWVWPANGKSKGRSEDAAEASNDRAHPARSSRPMLCMCSEERDFECPGGLWRPGIRFFSLLVCH